MSLKDKQVVFIGASSGMGLATAKAAAEAGAKVTYDDYLNMHGAELKAQPAPQVAINYYRDGDLYMFEEVQTTPGRAFRRPSVDNLYDVFVNIRDDECEHVKTMVALQQPEARLTFKSPHMILEVSVVSADETG